MIADLIDLGVLELADDPRIGRKSCCRNGIEFRCAAELLKVDFSGQKSMILEPASAPDRLI